MAKRKSPATGAKKQKSGLDKGNEGGGEGGGLTGEEKGKGTGTDFGVGYTDGEFSRNPDGGQNTEAEDRTAERNSN